MGGENQLIKSTLFCNTLSMLLQTKKCLLQNTKHFLWYCRNSRDLQSKNFWQEMTMQNCKYSSYSHPPATRVTLIKEGKSPFVYCFFTPSVIIREKLRWIYSVLKIFSADPFTDGRLGIGALAVLPVGLVCRHGMSSALIYYQERPMRRWFWQMSCAPNPSHPSCKPVIALTAHHPGILQNGNR